MSAGNETDGRLESSSTFYASFAIAVKLFFVQIDVGCYLLASSNISKLGKLTYRLLTLISVNLGQKENVLSFQLLQTRLSLFSTVLSLRFCGYPLFRGYYTLLTSGSLMASTLPSTYEPHLCVAHRAPHTVQNRIKP